MKLDQTQRNHLIQGLESAGALHGQALADFLIRLFCQHGKLGSPAKTAIFLHYAIAASNVAGEESFPELEARYSRLALRRDELLDQHTQIALDVGGFEV